MPSIHDRKTLVSGKSAVAGMTRPVMRSAQPISPAPNCVLIVFIAFRGQFT